MEILSYIVCLLPFRESWFEIRKLCYIIQILLRFYQSAKPGVPRYLKIMNICYISEPDPGNKGFLSISSANIHPIAQMSTEKLYFCCPSNIYGALYQTV